MSVSHHHQSIEIREKYALSAQEFSDAFKIIDRQIELQESFILSTCNRTEFYFITDEGENIHTLLNSIYSELNPVIQFNLSHWKKRFDMDAVTHFYRVCSGIDSMIVGETQITSQIKAALNIARKSKAAGFYLHRFIQTGLETGKQVRTDTDISKGAYSVSFAAVEKIRVKITNFQEKKILLIGAGNTGKLTASLFRKKGCTEIVVSNRSKFRGTELAEKIQCNFIAFNQIHETLPEIDIIVTCTEAPTPVLTLKKIKQSGRDFTIHPLILIDLSVPRNIQPELALIPGISLFTVDDLDGVVKYSAELRKQELPKVERIINKKVTDFQQWILDRSVSPVIAELKHHLEGIQKKELSRIQNKYDEKTLKAILNFSSSLIRKTMKQPIHVLKTKAAENQYPDTLVQSLRHLFKLNGEEDHPENGKELING